jgi:hypothetical protein
MHVDMCPCGYPIRRKRMGLAVGVGGKLARTSYVLAAIATSSYDVSRGGAEAEHVARAVCGDMARQLDLFALVDAIDDVGHGPDVLASQI